MCFLKANHGIVNAIRLILLVRAVHVKEFEFLDTHESDFFFFFFFLQLTILTTSVTS